MDIKNNVSLKDFSTMHLGGTTKHLTTVASKVELIQAVTWADENNEKIIVIGEGSNIVWKDDGYDGLVIVNAIKAFTVLDDNDSSATYYIGAGEDWDSVVERICANKLSGIECLSLIPGKAGATPVQNVGAYGQEIAQTLVELEAYDTQIKGFCIIKNQDCNFGYRSSRFKNEDKGRFIIIGITVRLHKTNLSPPFYANLQAYLEANSITDYSPQSIRKAVIAIRSKKLPDWHVVANNGSFFANPIISAASYEVLKKNYPDIPTWEYNGSYKISAGWLIEKTGFKGYHDNETGMSTSDKNALVLINENAHSTQDLLKFKQKITDAIKQKFDIILEQEPELLP